MRQIKDLPAHGDGLHFRGCYREKASRGRVAEVRVAEGGVGGALIGGSQLIY
jgi:hypothetical protein